MFKFFAALALAVSTSAFAGAKPGDVNETNTGIVTPDVAAGVVVYQDHTRYPDGTMVVCMRPAEYSPRNGCQLNSSQNAWTPMHLAVPPGRKFVGFKVVSREYGYRQIEVYYK